MVQEDVLFRFLVAVVVAVDSHFHFDCFHLSYFVHAVHLLFDYYLLEHYYELVFFVTITTHYDIYIDTKYL